MSAFDRKQTTKALSGQCKSVIPSDHHLRRKSSHPLKWHIDQYNTIIRNDPSSRLFRPSALPASGSRCCGSLCGNRLNWFPGRGRCHKHGQWKLTRCWWPLKLSRAPEGRNNSFSRWGAEWIPIIINWEVSWNHFIIVHHSDLAFLAIHYDVDVPLVCYYYSGVIALRWWGCWRRNQLPSKGEKPPPPPFFEDSFNREAEDNIKFRCPQMRLGLMN